MCKFQITESKANAHAGMQRFAAPIIKLTADDEHKCASVTIKKISDSLSAFGR